MPRISVSSLLHLLSTALTALVSLCHQQQLPEKDLNPSPAGISILHSPGHWLQSWEGQINSNVIACWVLRVPITLYLLTTFLLSQLHGGLEFV